MSGTLIRIALALLLGLAGAAAQETVETRGAWRLIASGPDFALRTQARGTTALSDPVSAVAKRAQSKLGSPKEVSGKRPCYP